MKKRNKFRSKEEKIDWKNGMKMEDDKFKLWNTFWLRSATYVNAEFSTIVFIRDGLSLKDIRIFLITFDSKLSTNLLNWDTY